MLEFFVAHFLGRQCTAATTDFVLIFVRILRFLLVLLALLLLLLIGQILPADTFQSVVLQWFLFDD